MGTSEYKMEIRNLGRVPYFEALKLQQNLRKKRAEDEITDTVLLLEHNHVYTMGRDKVNSENLIKNQLPSGAEIVNVSRGGKITYHGPGQLVAYFIFKVSKNQLGDFVNAIENLSLAVANKYGADVYSRKLEKDAYQKNIRGAWCNIAGKHRKLAAQGLETKTVPQEGTVVTMHGMALNVNTDLNYFKSIQACGFTYNVMTSLEEVLGEAPSINDVKRTFIEELQGWKSFNDRD
jgi:lipoyl(octanoyl) transferase